MGIGHAHQIEHALHRAVLAGNPVERVEHDIGLRGLKMVAEGSRPLARRTLDFGRAAYPDLVRKSRKARALKALLALGPLGTVMASAAYDRALRRYRAGNAGDGQ